MDRREVNTDSQGLLAETLPQHTKNGKLIIVTCLYHNMVASIATSKAVVSHKRVHIA